MDEIYEFRAGSVHCHSSSIRFPHISGWSRVCVGPTWQTRQCKPADRGCDSRESVCHDDQSTEDGRFVAAAEHLSADLEMFISFFLIAPFVSITHFLYYSILLLLHFFLPVNSDQDTLLSGNSSDSSQKNHDGQRSQSNSFLFG